MKIQKLVVAMSLAGLASFAVSSANATLLLRAGYQDAALSIDGFGGSSGQLQADVAAGSTIVKAYVYAASVWDGALTNFTFSGTTFTPAQGTLLAPNVNPATTNIYDVTSIVKPIIESGVGGIYNFNISDVNNDGEVLVIVYKNASTVGGTAIIMDGELNPSGDSTTLNFSTPYTTGNVIMSLASSFSYDSPTSGGQVTLVDVTTNTTNNRRLTSCAGGNDDGNFVAADGSLLTVGGVGDNVTNPTPNCSGAASDDELYNLALGNDVNAAPFVSSGNTFLTLKTSNPSGDDNVFGLFLTSSFQVTSVNDTPIGPTPPPTNNVPEPMTLGLMGLGLAGLAASRRRKQA